MVKSAIYPLLLALFTNMAWAQTMQDIVTCIGPQLHAGESRLFTDDEILFYYRYQVYMGGSGEAEVSVESTLSEGLCSVKLNFLFAGQPTTHSRTLTYLVEEGEIKNLQLFEPNERVTYLENGVEKEVEGSGDMGCFVSPEFKQRLTECNLNSPQEYRPGVNASGRFPVKEETDSSSSTSESEAGSADEI